MGAGLGIRSFALLYFALVALLKEQREQIALVALNFKNDGSNLLLTLITKRVTGGIRACCSLSALGIPNSCRSTNVEKFNTSLLYFILLCFCLHAKILL